MYVFPQFKSPKASHPLLFMLPWTPNACSDVSKYIISITTLMTHDIKMLLMCMFPHFNSPQGHRHHVHICVIF